MADLTARLLDPEKFKEALQEIEAYVPTDEIDDGPTAHIMALAKAVTELHALLATAKQYAAAPVDKGMPMHIYRAVCEQRDYEMGERQRMTHRYEVEVLRNREMEEKLSTAKAEGAAEALEKICMDVRCGGQAYSAKIHLEDGSYYKMGVVEASVIFAQAAAIRKAAAKEGK